VWVAEHKLFIGMLPKGATKADVMAVFLPYGNIKELSVIKGSQPTSKGSPLFIKLSSDMVFELQIVLFSFVFELLCIISQDHCSISSIMTSVCDAVPRNLPEAFFVHTKSMESSVY
jgi:hypothetical protein